MIYFYGFMLSMAVCYFLLPEGSREIPILRIGDRGQGGLIFRPGKIGEIILVLFAAAPLCIISALRYDLGTDFYNYTTEFIIILSGEDLQYESGFLKLARLIGKFWYTQQAIIIVTSVIFCGIVYYAMYKRSRNICFSLFIFFFSYNYFISLNNVRQCVAQAVALIGICALMRGKKILFAVFVLLASTIHQTAMIYLVLGVFSFVKIKAVVLLFISAFWFVTNKLLITVIVDFLMLVESKVPRLHGISFYLQNNMYTSRTVGRTLILFDFCILVLMVLMESVWMMKDTDSIEWKVIKYNQFLLLMVYGLDGSIPAVYRIARLFSFAQFIYFPNLVARIPEKRYRILAGAFICLGFLFFFMINYMRGAEGVFPYQCVLFR